MTERSILRKQLVLAAIISLVGVLSALSLSAAPVTGAVFVAPDGDDNADCLSLATACRSVSVAISRAMAGDAVLIASGLYTDSFTIDKPLTLIGYGPKQPVIQGPGLPEPRRVITVSAGIDAAIQNLTIQHGNATSETVPYGGGILNSGMLTLSYSTVAENQASDHGGGISNLEGTLYLLNSHIVNNTVYTYGFIGDSAGLHGGGVASLTGTVVISQSEVANNVVVTPYGSFTGGCGGGIENTSGTMTIGDSRIVSNDITVRGVGGGICTDGTLVVDRSDVANNVADVGIGIYNGGQLTLTRSMVHDNCTALLASGPAPAPARPQVPAQYLGGGIYNGGIFTRGVLVVAMSAIFGNCVPSGYFTYGGGIANDGAYEETLIRHALFPFVAR